MFAITVVVAVVLVGVAVGSAAPRMRSSATLPGSSFEGGDGDQVATAPNLDWRELQATGVVRHSPDPNAADSAFVGGSKENEPGAWDLTTEQNGVNPADANILDAWSAVDQPSGGKTFLYLAFRREKGTGSSFVVFELNRDARLWNNGRAMVPCRRTGDVLVAFEVTGNAVDVHLEQWTTGTTDSASGCARTGWFSQPTSVPADALQGAMNQQAIANYLPGFTPVGGTIAAGEFGEASLNLAKLLEVGFGDDCLAFASIWMHSRSSPSASSNMQDYVAPQPLAVRTCSASGTKFFDSNANGVRDPGEPGIPRFLIWADYNNDGIPQRGEPFSITDAQGHYVIYDIRPPNGTYTLRETLLTRKPARSPTDWVCSFPNASTPGRRAGARDGRFPCAWGPIDVATTPYASGRDFGNWYPAQLTVEKQLEPTSDPGRFDLLVNGQVAVAAAGDNAQTTLELPPGSYTVSEQPTPGTNAADYTSTVECRQNVNRRRQRSASVRSTIELLAGQRASCVFRNIRLGPSPTPAIAIDKLGPATATFGDTLHYTLYVTNPGAVAFAASDVKVSDAVCDAVPTLQSKHGPAGGADPTPTTLDPGDTWTYTCSHTTPSAGPGCTPTSVDNTGEVTGSAGGATVNDQDSITTILRCPDQPPEIEGIIPPQTTPPTQPGPVEPGGPPGLPPAALPPAGDAGRARLILRQALRTCVRTRVTPVTLTGTRIAHVRISVNGQLRKRLTAQTLQRRLTTRVGVHPGRNRITAHVVFQNGAGTRPLTLAETVRVCAAVTPPPPPPPRLTG